MKKRTVGILMFVLALTLSGCALTQTPSDVPPTPEQVATANQQKCDVAMVLASSGKLAAALTVKESTDQTLKDVLASLLEGVNVAVEAYCTAVVEGKPVQDQQVAFKALTTALDALTAKTLAPKITGP